MSKEEKFKTPCPHCKTLLSIRVDDVGKECDCPQCQRTFKVPKASIDVKCGKCQTALTCKLADAGKQASCPNCHAAFTVPQLPSTEKIRYVCVKCGKGCLINATEVGKSCACPNVSCGAKFIVPATSAPKPGAPPTKYPVQCVHCHARLETEHVGRLLQCPQCKGTFMPDGANGGAGGAGGAGGTGGTGGGLGAKGAPGTGGMGGGSGSFGFKAGGGAFGVGGAGGGFGRGTGASFGKTSGFGPAAAPGPSGAPAPAPGTFGAGLKSTFGSVSGGAPFGKMPGAAPGAAPPAEVQKYSFQFHCTGCNTKLVCKGTVGQKGKCPKKECTAPFELLQANITGPVAPAPAPGPGAAPGAAAPGGAPPPAPAPAPPPAPTQDHVGQMAKARAALEARNKENELKSDPSSVPMMVLEKDIVAMLGTSLSARQLVTLHILLVDDALARWRERIVQAWNEHKGNKAALLLATTKILQLEEVMPF